MSAVLGVDLASMRIAVTCVSTRGARPVSYDWRWPDLSAEYAGRRLTAYRRRLILEVLPQLPPRPLAIGIEDPKHRQYSRILQATFGVVLEVFCTRYRCPVLDMSVKEWKRSQCGSGNATKLQGIARSIECGGAANWTEDQHDAHLIALHTRHLAAVHA